MSSGLAKACTVCGTPVYGGPEKCAKHRQQPTDLEKDKWRHNEPLHELYNDRAWRGKRVGLRDYVRFVRDPVCTCTEINCHGVGACRRLSTVTDHIKDHRGNRDLFLDPKNVRGLCKLCHDAKTGKEHGFNNYKPRADLTPGAFVVSSSKVQRQAIQRSETVQESLARLLKGRA